MELPNYDLVTPLLAALMNNHIDVVKELLQRGARTDSPLYNNVSCRFIVLLLFCFFFLFLFFFFFYFLIYISCRERARSNAQ